MKGFINFTDNQEPEGISVEQYIVSNNPDGVDELLTSYGLPAPMDDTERMLGITHLTTEHGAEFVRNLLKYHPDSNMINGAVAGGKWDEKINTVFVKLPVWAKVIGLGVLFYGSYQFYFNKSQ